MKICPMCLGIKPGTPGGRTVEFELSSLSDRLCAECQRVSDESWEQERGYPRRPVLEDPPAMFELPEGGAE